MCECACMFVCHDIMLLIGVCAGHGIHGNNCEVSAHIPPSYLVSLYSIETNIVHTCIYYRYVSL